jgi:HEPN domain
MSNMRQLSGEDYPDAARKHYTDARALMNRRRYDGAAYLAGYAVECILKTIIQVNQPSRVPMIHDINKLSVDAQRLATMPSSRTARYFSLGSSVTRLPYGNPPAGWKETLRYHCEGTIPKTTASDWVAEAKRLYEYVLWGLIKDGEVTL